MLIHDHMTAVCLSVWKQALSLREMVHEGTKGAFNELFLSGFLGRFLPEPLGAASGVIIDSEGHQSNQTDVILFDKRICPHLIVASHQVVCPVESVIGTIEVKTRLYDQAEIADASDSVSAFLSSSVNCFPEEEVSRKPEWPPFRSYFFAFDFGQGRTFSDLSDESTGRGWLTVSARALSGVTVMGRLSWMSVQGSWALKAGDQVAFEESKRFAAILADNMRTLAERR